VIKLPVNGVASRPLVVINVGGSIVAPEPIDPGFIGRLAEVLKEAASDRTLLLVVGGGRTARRYISACRELGASETYLDTVGIDATRLNARLLVAAMPEVAYNGVPSTVELALEAARDHRVVVMGGTVPGQTTDAVGAELAERAVAEELLILTNVDGVYTADPRKDPDARRIPELSSSELLTIVTGEEYRAGSTTVVDPVAASIILRSSLITKVLDGRDLDQVRAALAGEPFEGTVVTSER
jgi:uridylate kinase